MNYVEGVCENMILRAQLIRNCIMQNHRASLKHNRSRCCKSSPTKLLCTLYERDFDTFADRGFGWLVTPCRAIALHKPSLITLCPGQSLT